MNIDFDVEEISTEIAFWFSDNEEVESFEIFEKIEEYLVDFKFYLYDCSKEKLEKYDVKVIE